MEHGTDIRTPAVAGSFYPNDPIELASLLDGYFQKTNKITEGKIIKALIVPHAGYIYSGQTAAWGYKQLEVKSHFVFIGPTHHFYFDGIVGNDFAWWATPLGNIPHIHPVVSDAISIDKKIFETEHSLEVQVPFLQHIFKDISITAFLTGSSVDVKKTADYLIRHYSSSLFIISSDLSHYLPIGTAALIDKKTISAISKDDISYFQTKENVACGGKGISILLEMAKRKHWENKLIMYDTSAAESKDTKAVVGYASVCFFG